MTTLEVSNLGRYGFMGGRGGANMAGQMGHRHQHSTLHNGNETFTEDGSSTASGHISHHHRRSHTLFAGCGSGFLMNLLGFDRFTKGKAVDGLARAGKASNPFDLGIVGNCKDFWTMGHELGVDYDKVYDIPAEGFLEAKKKKEKDEDVGVAYGKRSKGIFLSMGRGLGIGTSRAGYEPVSQV
jgi:palmitoyltransferase ZDHHC13/17